MFSFLLHRNSLKLTLSCGVSAQAVAHPLHEYQTYWEASRGDPFVVVWGSAASTVLWSSILDDAIMFLSYIL